MSTKAISERSCSFNKDPSALVCSGDLETGSGTRSEMVVEGAIADKIGCVVQEKVIGLNCEKVKLRGIVIDSCEIVVIAKRTTARAR